MLEQQLLTELHCKKQHSEQLLTELTEKMKREQGEQDKACNEVSETFTPPLILIYLLHAGRSVPK